MFEKVDLEQFRNIVAYRLGLQLEECRDELLTRVLQSRMQANGYAKPASYCAWINCRNASEEFRLIASQLTISETYFFRGTDQFRALSELAIPERIRQRKLSPDEPLRILSAGCASGDESYSIAIVLRERFPALEASEFEISGIDLSYLEVAKARQGRYHQWSFRETPA